ncbi:MAG: nucleotidyltransferase [Verrucomicrobia bacterium]|nr:nucleotidyltransferase [Verrucomicrobiota bacterium]
MRKLESLLELLIQRQVEFVVVGGYAAVAHGVTLLTQDIDICCRFTPENLAMLEKALADLHPVHRMTTHRRPFDLARDWRPDLKNLYLDTDWGQLDCLSSVLAVGDFDAVQDQSVELGLPTGRCRVLGIDALIKAKNAMGRLQDKVAAMQLTSIRERKRQEEAVRSKPRRGRP